MLLENVEFQRDVKIAIDFAKIGSNIDINKRMDNLRESIREIAKYYGTKNKNDLDEELKTGFLYFLLKVYHV